MAKTVEQLVGEAMRRITSATPDEVSDAVLSGELVVVDVREPDEFENGHIPGAVNIPRGWLEFKADPRCPAYDERITRSSCTLPRRNDATRDAARDRTPNDVALPARTPTS